MVRRAAQVIGVLIILLMLVVWLVFNQALPIDVGFSVHLVAVLVALLSGLMAYVSVLKG